MAGWLYPTLCRVRELFLPQTVLMVEWIDCLMVVNSYGLDRQRPKQSSHRTIKPLENKRAHKRLLV
jgi:hypothetical protein